jgi:replicative DNA helicase
MKKNIELDMSNRFSKEDRIIKKQNVESMERYFFAYIMENPAFFNRVESASFNNDKIGFIYKRVKDYYSSSENPIVPAPKKILELIRLDDADSKIITNQYLQHLLQVDIGDIVQSKDDDYLRKSLYSWCTSNKMKQKMMEAVDFIRDMNDIDFNNTEKIANKVRDMMTSATLMDYDDDDLGLSFFNAEHHVQDISRNKISTGWSDIDVLTNGGWDRKTLNVVIGPSNSGKSLWLCNMAVNSANAGKNVIYISLEMSDSLVMKRIGSASLRIHIDEYDERSKDVAYMNKKLRNLRGKKSKNSDGFGDAIFEDSIGDISIKEYPSGSASVADIDNFIKRVEEVKKIKVDMVIIDYLTIMQPDSKGADNLFMNGKFLSNGLRAIAQKRELVMITAMQVGKDNYGATDITMADISESKAIAENADSIWGIIRSDQMRRDNKYILKLLKIRNGSFKWEMTQFDLNTDYLSIENATRLDFS